MKHLVDEQGQLIQLRGFKYSSSLNDNVFWGCFSLGQRTFTDEIYSQTSPTRLLLSGNTGTSGFLYPVDDIILFHNLKLFFHFSPTIELPSPMRRVVDRPGAAPVPQRVPPWRRPSIGSIRINLDQIGSYYLKTQESPDHQREEEELTAPDHQHRYHKLQVDQLD